MRIRPQHRALLAAATAAALALTLTACDGDDQGAAPAGPKESAAGAPSEAGASAAPTGASKPDEQPAGEGGSQAPGAAGGGSAGNTEEYAYQHPCTMNQLTLKVTDGTGTQRIVEVANTGKNACGLDLLPAVDFGEAASADQSGNLHPLVPGGLGGPGHALLAGTKAYAVIDLNPGGEAAGAEVDEMNVLVSPAHMAAADTRNFPLGSGTQVSAPKLGLYQATVADAAASAKGADTPQQ